MTALLPPQRGTTFADALLGDQDALDELLRRHRPSVEAVCFRRLRSRTDAEDAVQETMVRGMRSLQHVDDPTRLKSYLCRIAERVCLDMLRAGAKAMPYVVEDVLDSSDGTDEPETVALERERARLVHETLQALSERQATALWMRDALGEPVPVVAERLGVTEGSARVLLTRARAKMRDGWAKVAALLPGAGVKLPAFAAKTAHLGPIAAVPALVIVAAVAVISPTAFQALQDDGQVIRMAPGSVATKGSPTQTMVPIEFGSTPTSTDVVVISTPVTTAPVVGSGERATEQARPRLDVGVASVGREPDTGEDDPVTVGDEDLLEVGAGLGEQLEALVRETGLPDVIGVGR